MSLRIYYVSPDLEANLLPGNELKLSVDVPGMAQPWSAKGLVTKITD